MISSRLQSAAMDASIRPSLSGSGGPMIVVDDTLEIARAARHLFASGESRLAFAGSLHELPLVMQASGTPTVVLINVAGEITAHEVATRLERWSYRGRVVALVENQDDAGMRS